MAGISMLAAVGLLGASALHVLWAFSPWPCDGREEFSRSVLGQPRPNVPKVFPLMSLAVAALLFASAYLVASLADLVPAAAPESLTRAGVWVVAGVLLVRATVGGFVPSALRLTQAPPSYVRLDLAVYSPVCLLLGGLAAVVAVSAG